MIDGVNDSDWQADLLAEKIYYKQFADVTYGDGSKKEVEQITRSYKPGRNFGLFVSYKF